MSSVVATTGITAATKEFSNNNNKNESIRPKSAKHLYAGFMSGLTSAVTLQPLDLLKTRIQQSKGTSLKNALAQVQLSGLWRGTIPSALRTSVGSALYFTTLNYTRTMMASRKQNQESRATSKLPVLSMHANLISGSFVRGFVGFITMPITVLKVRYESSLYKYNSMFEAVKHIFQKHGIRGFFSGFGVTFARDAPYAGLYVLFYEKTKDVLSTSLLQSEHAKTNNTTAAMINSGSAMLSATMATTITAPFDTIKTRVQLDPVKYPNFINSAKLIVQEGGPRALFDGLSLRLARKAMSAGIAWCIYEELVRRS